MKPNLHRERRRTSAERVLKKRGTAGMLAGVRTPLQKALGLLSRNANAVDTVWQRLLRRLEPGREEFAALSALNLRLHARHLRSADYDAYGEAFQREGRNLAARGVPEEHVVAALAFQLESCLSYLVGAEGGDKSLALALVRLTAAIQTFVLSGYRDDRAAGWRRLDEQERLKLSRDLHDEIGADLVVLKLYMEMIALELSRGNLEPVNAKLQEALDLVGHAIESVRRLTLDLGPAILEQIGFLPAVRLYARQFGARTTIKVEVREADLPAEIPTSHETALYRVLQGALSNVAKHSHAKNVRITVGGLRNAVLVMIIEDDGVGFEDGRNPKQRAFGLTAMRERVQGLGGRLHIESRRARGTGGRSGTRIEIDLPLKSDKS